MKIHYPARHGGLRLRLWLLIGLALSALVCCTVASTRRLQALVSKERAQELNHGGSLLARADARVLKHLPGHHAGERRRPRLSLRSSAVACLPTKKTV